MGEEFDFKKPTEPETSNEIRKPVLFGFRFKRSVHRGASTISFLSGTSKAYEHSMDEVVLSCVHVNETTYVVDADTNEIFGHELLGAFSEVIATSSLFAAHRERGMLCVTPKDAFAKLELLSKGDLASKDPTIIETVLITLYAQFF